MHGVAEVQQALGQIVQGLTGFVEAFAEGGEDGRQFVVPGEAMIAGHPEVGAAKVFVVAQVRKAFLLGAMADALREYAGEEEGVVADVGADEEGGAFIGLLQGGHHLEEVFQRIEICGELQVEAFQPGELSEQLGDVVRDLTIFDADLAQDTADQHVEIEVRGNLEAARALQQGLIEPFVIEDLVACLFIGEEADE